MGIDQHGAPIDSLQDFLAHHLTWTSHREDPTVFKDDDAITILTCQIQIVGDEHDRQTTFLFERMQDRTNVELVLEIKKGRRLIEQQHLGRLSQGASNDGSLTLASGEVQDRPLREVRHIHGDHRLLRDGAILGTVPAKSVIPARSVPVRISTHQDTFRDAERKGRLSVLRNNSDLTRHLHVGRNL